MSLGVFMEKYKINQVIKCKVTGIEKYGIFVNIDKNFNGLIHISEISNDFVRNVNDYVKVGDAIFAKIVEISQSNNQMKLSIKDIDYRNTGLKRKSMESPNGFEPLKEQLPTWMKESLAKVNNN